MRQLPTRGFSKALFHIVASATTQLGLRLGLVHRCVSTDEVTGTSR